MNTNTESLINSGSTWLPGSYSTMSDMVDLQFYFILVISIIFSVAIFVVTLLFTIKYRRTKNNLIAKKQIVHNDKLEIIWTVIPLIIVLFIFIGGLKVIYN